jgi:uncharacterized protein YjiS (DUF1127 family)
MSTFSTSSTDVSLRSSSRGSALLRVVAMIEMAVERRRSRLALLEMSDAQLKDIGISRSEAYREANRPFWG